MNVDFFHHKTILVTGATGLLGSCIVEHALQTDGVKVIAMGRNLKKLQECFRHVPAKADINLLEHDISLPLPPSLGHVDYIFHAASPIAGDVIRTAPMEVIQANLNGTLHCLEYLRKQEGGKMIVFSSATVYSPAAFRHEAASEPQTEMADAIEHPNAAYSESKRMIEVIANAYHRQYGTDTLIARFSYLYGYCAHPAQTAFYEFIGKALSGEDITLNRSGLPPRDNIYVEDAVEALFHLCAISEPGETYNISACEDAGNYAAIDEIAECIAAAANELWPEQRINVVYKTPAEGSARPQGLRLDNAKLKATGWCVRTSLAEGIRKTLSKFKAHL